MKPKAPVNYGPLGVAALNLMRGKMLMDHTPNHDVWKVFGCIDWLEDKLNETDYDDMLGTEGWRHFFGHPDAT